ncbi:hypothetical protein [Acidocella sp.]|uniref:hypothetical protein n=1 Tax=Acidocella sp. TaxID=50710 RepID=UPI00261FC929|nr:hypothetical protein [Acidocella sp.]
MRDDMAKIIVERPRRLDHSGRKGRARALEDLPQREGMRRPHLLWGWGKELNENLQPLRRYLERQVGRPWDKVYAEIAKNLRVDNTVQQHVRDHLHDYVAVTPRRVFGGWWSRSRSGLWYQPLYVDPVTGLLCRTDRLPEEKARRRAKQNRPPEPPARIELAPDRELRLIEGLWYEVRLAPMPVAVFKAGLETQTRPLRPYDPKSPMVTLEVLVRRLVTPAVCDVVAGALIEVGPAVDDPTSWRKYRTAHPDRRYAVAKRVLSRQELQRHGVRNAAPKD